MEALQVWDREHRGVVRVVTGGGKTVFSYLCMERFFDEHADGRAIVVVPTLALLDQWFVDICDATSLEGSEVECYAGHFRPAQPGRVNILVINSARNLVKDLSKIGPTILIVDECHRAGTVENSRALEGFHQATLGLSATPQRDADDGFETFVAPALGPIVHSYSYRDAKVDGVIVDFNLVNIKISVDNDDGLQHPPAASVRGGRHPKHLGDALRDGFLRRADPKRLKGQVEHAMRIPWAVKIALSHRDERVIIFHERVQSLGKITDLLSKCGQNSVAYHSQLSESHRRDNLRLFRRGEINILVTCRALDEGANVPEANIAIVAHSTSSTRQRIQRLGRVLRPARGKEYSTVYTLYAHEEQQKLLAEEAAGLEGLVGIDWKTGYVR